MKKHKMKSQMMEQKNIRSRMKYTLTQQVANRFSEYAGSMSMLAENCDVVSVINPSAWEQVQARIASKKTRSIFEQ